MVSHTIKISSVSKTADGKVVNSPLIFFFFYVYAWPGYLHPQVLFTTANYIKGKVFL